MIKIKPIYYEIQAEGLIDFFEQNKKDILLLSEEAIRFCSEKEISVSHDVMYSYIEDWTIRIYSNMMLVYINDLKDGFTPVSFTEAFLKSSNVGDSDSLERSVMMMILSCFYIAYMVETGKKKTKRQQGTFYTIYKLKDARCTAKRYEQGTDLFCVHENHGKVSVLCNHLKRDSFSIPNSVYTMPNKNAVRAFYPANTKDLDDGGELDHILSSIPQQVGKCYLNCENIIKAVKEAGYDKKHTVEYYGGWIYYCDSDKLTHHAWVVVDGDSVIDMTIKKAGKFVEYMEQIENGIYQPFSREILAQWTHDEATEGARFSKYHYYGNTGKSVYIGVKCTAEEAKESFRNILMRNSNIPGYQNTKNGAYENAFQKLYRKKYETDKT